MLGPTAEDLDDKTATGTSEAGIAFLLEKGKTLMPQLLEHEVTATYAGLRATIESDDYLIDTDQSQRYVLVAGIRSTGLTSSMAVGEYVRDQLAAAGLELTPRAALPAPPGCRTSESASPAHISRPSRSRATPHTVTSSAFANV